MKTGKRLFRLSFSVVFALWLVAGILFVSTLLLGCQKEECLAWGENCTQQYKQNEYGTTDIQCCKGQCANHGSGIVTCGS